MIVTVEQAQSSLKELIERSTQGESILITQDEKPVAQIVPVGASVSAAAPKPKPRFGSCKGMLIIVSDDDDHLKDFAEYMP